MSRPVRVPVSVVMPAYNEEGGIAAAVAEVQRHVLDAVPGAEVVVVDDGSRDGTGALLDAIAAADPRVRVLHTPNGGHGTALLRGVAATHGDWVFLIDSDDQIPLGEGFGVLWAAAHTAGGGVRDGAFGVRRHRNDAPLRRVLTVVIRWSLRLMFGVRLVDANVPFKLVRRDVWLEARAVIPDGTLAPSLFLAVYMQRRRPDIAFVDVAHRDRATGTVSIRRWKLLKFCARAFRQLLAFRRALRGR